MRAAPEKECSRGGRTEAQSLGRTVLYSDATRRPEGRPEKCIVGLTGFEPATLDPQGSAVGPWMCVVD